MLHVNDSPLCDLWLAAVAIAFFNDSLVPLSLPTLPSPSTALTHLAGTQSERNFMLKIGLVSAR